MTRRVIAIIIMTQSAHRTIIERFVNENKEEWSALWQEAIEDELNGLEENQESLLSECLVDAAAFHRSECSAVQHAFHMAELDDEPVEEELVNEKANAVHATLCFFRSVCMLIHFVESYKAFRSHRVLEMVSTLSSLLPCLSLISNNDVVCEILLFVLEFLQTINKESGLDAGTVEAASADLLSSLVEVIVNKGFSQYLIANPFLVESMQLSSQFVLSVNDECATPNYITSYLLKGGFLIDHGMETYHSLTHVHCPYSVLESCNEECDVLKKEESGHVVEPVVEESVRVRAPRRRRRLQVVLSDRSSESEGVVMPEEKGVLSEERGVIREEKDALSEEKDALTEEKTPSDRATPTLSPDPIVHDFSPPHSPSIHISPHHMHSPSPSPSLDEDHAHRFSVHTPSAAYRASLFTDAVAPSSASFNSEFAFLFNTSFLTFLHHAFTFYSVPTQVRCVRTVLRAYEENASTLVVLLEYLFSHWMDAFFAEDKPGKQEVVALILEMAEKQPAWRASLLSALETGILRTMSENAEGAATLRHVTNKWALLLALYQKNRDASCCASVFSLVAWCVRSIQTLQPALLSLSLSLCFSLVDVLTQEHANALFLSKSKYVVMNLSERMDVLDGEAAFSCALFLLWLVQNEEFALASSRQCVIWACILLAKRVVVLLESEEEGEGETEARQRLKHIFACIGHVLLTITQKDSERFRMELSHYSSLDRQLAQFCCQKYVQLKNR